MEQVYQFVDDVIEGRRNDFCAIADDIWDHPETRFQEFWSAARLADALEAEGFQLTRNAGGIPNAFIASFGAGQPVIALLGEFDALTGLSQQAHCAAPASPTPGENGHGCGHNLLGTAGGGRHGCRPDPARRRGRRQELAAAARRHRHPALLRLSR